MGWTNKRGSVGAGAGDCVQSGAHAGLWVLQSVHRAWCCWSRWTDWTVTAPFGVSRRTRVSRRDSPSETVAELRSSDRCALYQEHQVLSLPEENTSDLVSRGYLIDGVNVHITHRGAVKITSLSAATAIQWSPRVTPSFCNCAHSSNATQHKIK